MKATDKKIIDILKTLYDVVWSEEHGGPERACEYFSSDELKSILEKLEAPIKPNLSNKEIEEAVNDFFCDNPDLKSFDLTIIMAWLQYTDLNGPAREIFRSKVRERLSIESWG